MFSFSISKSVSNISKLSLEIKNNNTKFLYLTAKGEEITLFFSESLSQSEIDSISYIVNNFVEYNVIDNLSDFFNKKVDIFTADFLTKIRAENVAMGITQLRLTKKVQSWFEKRVDIDGSGDEVSLQGTLYSGSLTVSLDIINYFINNPLLYQSMSPIITEDRLEEWRNHIVSFLNS